MSKRLEALRSSAVKAYHWVFDAEQSPHVRPRQSETTAAAGRDDTATASTTGDGKTFHYERLRFWVAMAIVIAAVSAAAAAWRAEMFSEYANQKEALFRQDLSGQQLSERSDEELAISQLRQLGVYQRDLKIAYDASAQTVPGAGRAARTLEEAAQTDWTLVDAERANDFSLVMPTDNVENGTATLSPRMAYASAVMSDPNLASFDPADLDALAHRARADAQDMAAVGVLFALTVVLFTVSEMILRRRTEGPEKRWSSGHTVAVVTAVVWLGGLALFILLYLDVPHLR